MELVGLLLFIFGAMAGRWIAPRKNGLWLLLAWSGVWAVQFYPWIAFSGRYSRDLLIGGLIASTIILSGGWTGYWARRLVLWRTMRGRASQVAVQAEGATGESPWKR